MYSIKSHGNIRSIRNRAICEKSIIIMYTADIIAGKSECLINWNMINLQTRGPDCNEGFTVPLFRPMAIR